MEILKDTPTLVEVPVHQALEQGCRLPLRPCSPGYTIRKATSLTLIFIVSVGVSQALLTPAQSQTASDYQIKANFLYNVAKFIEWPPEAFADAKAPMILGILGGDPFGVHFARLMSGKTVNGRALLVKHLNWGDNLQDCRILLISASERKRLPQIFEGIKGASVLTVSEMDQFPQLGGIVKFTLKDDKIDFEINTEAAGCARLHISSKLLSLAKVVRDERAMGRK